ncbi:MAG TPA: DNA repair protein RadC [Clostridia bacterium]|nr:DNA repair protein RadC [Clostridia bacterium]
MGIPEYHISIKDLPREERPRERLAAYGPESLSDRELLAVLIGSGSGTASALDVAGMLISKFPDGSLKYLTKATLEELESVPGIGRAIAVRIKAAAELSKRLGIPDRRKAIIRTAEDAGVVLMEKMRYLEAEHFCELLLDTKNRLLGFEVISVGTIDTSVVHPREVFKLPIRRCAAAVILAHNHPSGDPSPSREDISITGRLIEAGRILGIEVLDHLIVGDGRYVSMREHGFGLYQG